MNLFRLVDQVAEAYLDLIDILNDEIDELEDHVEDWRGDRLRTRISTLRHDLLHIRRTLTPTRDAVRRIVDDRVELDDYELFPREVELYFADSYDKFLRATEGLETSRDLVAGVREYFQAKIAIDQNEVMKRLTMVASLLLLPTFIVGLYGQNFHHMPELAWHFGYAWSWVLIIAHHDRADRLLPLEALALSSSSTNGRERARGQCSRRWAGETRGIVPMPALHRARRQPHDGHDPRGGRSSSATPALTTRRA